MEGEHDAANTMQNDKFKFQTVANTRQMVPAKKSKKKSQTCSKENPKTISHPFFFCEQSEFRGFGGRAFLTATKSRNQVVKKADAGELFQGYVPGGNWVTVGYRNLGNGKNENIT